jgi:Na+/H+ antiporter NhaC
MSNKESFNKESFNHSLLLAFVLYLGGGVGDFRSNLFWGQKTEQSFNHSINPYQALPISIISIGTVLTCYIQHGKNNNK